MGRPVRGRRRHPVAAPPPRGRGAGDGSLRGRRRRSNGVRALGTAGLRPRHACDGHADDSRSWAFSRATWPSSAAAPRGRRDHRRRRACTGGLRADPEGPRRHRDVRRSRDRRAGGARQQQQPALRRRHGDPGRGQRGRDPRLHRPGRARPGRRELLAARVEDRRLGTHARRICAARRRRHRLADLRVRPVRERADGRCARAAGRHGASGTSRGVGVARPRRGQQAPPRRGSDPAGGGGLPPGLLTAHRDPHRGGRLGAAAPGPRGPRLHSADALPDRRRGPRRPAAGHRARGAGQLPGPAADDAVVAVGREPSILREERRSTGRRRRLARSTPHCGPRAPARRRSGRRCV